MNQLLIWGTGGHGRVVLESAVATRRFQQVEFVDDACREPRLGEYRVRGGRAAIPEAMRAGFSSIVVAIGDNRMRRNCFEYAAGLGCLASTIVHPAAVLSPSAAVGPGTVVLARAIVQAGASVGANCIINSGAIVEHDCVIGDHCHMAPGTTLGGNVRVGSFSLVGIGATVLPGICIGEGAIVGAGSVVLKDVDSGETVVGAPARRLLRTGR